VLGVILQAVSSGFSLDCPDESGSRTIDPNHQRARTLRIMTRSIAAIILATSLVAVTHSAHAFEGWYVGGAVHWLSFEEDIPQVDIDLDLGVASFIGGYRFNQHLALEGTFRTGIRDDSVGPFKVGLDHYFSAAVLGRWPFTPGFGVYGTVGYGRATFSVRGFAGGGFNESDLLLGGGVHFTAGTVLVRAGVERLIDAGDVRLQGFKLGVIFDL
jgi:hypothetical protein